MTQLDNPTDAVIQVTDLVKRYGDFVAVNGASFDVQHGETYGLLGPNGAGKTTTMRILSGLSPFNGGKVTVSGINAAEHPRDVRRKIGVITQHDGLDTTLNAVTNLVMHGYLAGLGYRDAKRRAKEVLTYFQLQDRAKHDVRAMSGGMKRRLAIARSMMTSPGILIMDEPTTGLDPQSRNSVWEQLGELKQAGVTVLMSTHYMVEAEVLCDRVAIIDHGQIFDVGTPTEVVGRHVGDDVAIVQINNIEQERLAIRRLQAAKVGHTVIGSRIVVPGANGNPPDLSFLTDDINADITHRAPNLEDAFLAMTGRALRDE